MCQVKHRHCGTCFFLFREDVRQPGGDIVELRCHRFPPSKDGFPLVNDDDWCGEYQKRPVLPEEVVWR